MKRSAFFKTLGPVGGFVASQLASPHGFAGRVLMTRLLNRGNRDLVVATLDSLELSPDDCLLDIGFGGGVALEIAAARGVRRLEGVDPSADAVAAVSRRLSRLVRSGTLRLGRGSVEQLPFQTASLDAVLSTNTVYFWPDLRLALAEVHRVLRKDGRLALGFSGSDKLRHFDVITRHGFHFHETAFIAEQARTAGFEAVSLLALHGRATEGDVVLSARAGGPHGQGVQVRGARDESAPRGTSAG